MSKTKVTIETDRNVEEVKIVWSDLEANELLKKGWMLMSSGVAHRDEAGYQAKPMFILAKK
jgi:hypothetical protein